MQSQNKCVRTVLQFPALMTLHRLSTFKKSYVSKTTYLQHVYVLLICVLETGTYDVAHREPRLAHTEFPDKSYILLKVLQG